MTVKHKTTWDGLVDESGEAINKISALSYNEDHDITPDTIANTLSDHNKAAHDALDIDAGTVDGVHSSSIIKDGDIINGGAY
jgi:hypothetical protein